MHKISVALGVLYAIGVCCYFSHIDFINPIAAAVAGIFLWTLPLFLLWLAFRWSPQRKTYKVLQTVAVILMALFSLASAIFILFSIISLYQIITIGQDPAYKLIHQISYGPSDIDVYLGDCGAMCDWNLDVIQEQPVGFDLEVSRDIFSAYGADDAQIRVIDSDHIELTSIDFSDSLPGDEQAFQDSNPKIVTGVPIELDDKIIGL